LVHRRVWHAGFAGGQGTARRTLTQLRTLSSRCCGYGALEDRANRWRKAGSLRSPTLLDDTLNSH
jgi:hypothetical protein